MLVFNGGKKSTTLKRRIAAVQGFRDGVHGFTAMDEGENKNTDFINVYLIETTVLYFRHKDVHRGVISIILYR